MKINIVIAFVILFLAVLSINIHDNRLENIETEVQNTAKEINAMIKSGRNTVELLETIVNSKYKHLDSYDVEYISELKETEIDGHFALDNPSFANLAGYDGIPKELNVLKEMELSLDLTKYMKKIHELHKKYAWVYYISKNKFCTSYPYLSSKEFFWDNTKEDKNVWTMALKENNPERKLFVTPPYVDEWGLGAMVTLGKPIYYKNEFMGVVDLDITLSILEKFLQKRNLHKGSYLIADRENNLLALSASENFTLKNIDKNLLTNEKLQLIDENYVYAQELKFLPWKIYYYKSKYDVYLEVLYYVLAGLFLLLILFQVKQLLKDLSIAECSADRANAMKSSFLANMSHEIRTPMNSVIGFSELLKETELTSKQQGYVKSIQSGGKSLLTLINDILDISKIEAGKFQLEEMEVDLEYICNDLKALFEEKCKIKGLSFEIELEENTPKVIQSDEVRIRQILINLISNAIKFTDKGSVKLHLRYENDSLIFSVIDTGMGVSQEEQTSIFEAFTQQMKQSNKEYGGTGLGLSISSKLAKLLGGTLTCQSDGKSGSSFIFTMQNVNVLDKESVAKKEIDENVFFNYEKVLIVDDVEENIILLKSMLEMLHLDVSSAKNGLIALEMAQKEKFSLILTDIRMPVMDGEELLQKLRADENYKTGVILAVTASVMKEDISRLVESGFDEVIEKPIEFVRVKNVLKKYLKHTVVVLVDENEDEEKSLKLTKVSKEIFQKYEEAKKSGMLDDMSEFASFCESEGNQKKDDDLIVFAALLLKSIEDFDIETMEALKKQFENMEVE